MKACLHLSSLATRMESQVVPADQTLFERNAEKSMQEMRLGCCRVMLIFASQTKCLGLILVDPYAQSWEVQRPVHAGSVSCRGENTEGLELPRIKPIYLLLNSLENSHSNSKSQNGESHKLYNLKALWQLPG